MVVVGGIEIGDILQVRNGYHGKVQSDRPLALSTWSGGVGPMHSSTWTLLSGIPPQSLEKVARQGIESRTSLLM